ncbi:hypothetical protein ColTof4_11831 [Colletotrichum tofieldiae]|nr:hypothetical protein ColTof3_03095 [Colletotrichum tofieldiae]GKT79408.1 hypothetical protein ColTof4_11831 [Colletotrichum tofieldiae]
MTLTIGLAGITGKFGRLLASKLIKNPNITLRGYYRDPEKIHLFQGEAFNEDNIRKFVKGCAVVICAYLATTSS